MNRQFDVIVIGGGIIGLASAYHLSRRGQRVLVLEKKYPG
ncbi:MAG: FAD-dependent oxidoreductase, partial [Chrysiogenales bacterium]